VSPRVWTTRGLGGDVQVLGKEFTAADRYVADRAWQRAILCECPFHPEGGCGLHKLGTYTRVEPVGTRVARFWCPRARQSISVLPAFLAARMSGTLDAIEAVVATVEQVGSAAAAVEQVHPQDQRRAVGHACALRSIRRRLRAVRAVLVALVTWLPEQLCGVAPTLGAVRLALGTERALLAVRELLAPQLHAMSTPVGLRPRVSA
jgi:hypothetical protein